MSKNENIDIGAISTTDPNFFGGVSSTSATMSRECWCNHFYDNHSMTLHGEQLGCNKCDCPAYDTNYVYIKVRTTKEDEKE